MGEAGAHPEAARTVRVGILTEALPFSHMEEGQAPSGFSVHLWEAIAKEKKWKSVYVAAGPSVKEALKHLQNNHYDVLIGPLRLLPPLAGVHFSRGYYLNRDTVVTAPKPLGPWKKFFLYCPPTLLMMLWVVGIGVLIGPLILMRLEPTPGKPWGTQYAQALFDCMMGVVLVCPYKTYRKVWLTGVFFLWTWCSLYLSFALSAIIYGSYVLGTVYEEPLTLSSMREKTFFYSTEFMSDEFHHHLQETLGICLVPMTSFEDTIQAILSHKVDGIFGNAPMIEMILRRYPQATALRASSLTLSSNLFSFVSREDFPYEEIDEMIEQMRRTDQVLLLCQKTLGPRYFTTCTL